MYTNHFRLCGGKFDVHTKHKTLPSHSSCTRAPPSHHARSHERSRQAACGSPIFLWPRPVVAVTGGLRLPQQSACRAPKRHPRMTTLVSEFARALLDAGAALYHLMIMRSTFPPARLRRVLRADLLVSSRFPLGRPPPARLATGVSTRAPSIFCSALYLWTHSRALAGF